MGAADGRTDGGSGRRRRTDGRTEAADGGSGRTGGRRRRWRRRTERGGRRRRTEAADGGERTALKSLKKNSPSAQSVEKLETSNSVRCIDTQRSITYAIITHQLTVVRHFVPSFVESHKQLSIIHLADTKVQTAVESPRKPQGTPQGSPKALPKEAPRQHQGTAGRCGQ